MDKGASVPDQALAVPVEPVARLDPSGFDPSRIAERRERALYRALGREWRSLRELRLTDNTRLLIKPAQSLAKRGLIESKLGPQYNLIYRRVG